MNVFRNKVHQIGFSIAVVLVIGWSLAPYLWFAVTSLKSPIEIAARPPGIIPNEIHLENYARLGSHHRLWIPVRNSVIIAGVTTLITVPVAALAAYALSAAILYRVVRKKTGSGWAGFVTVGLFAAAYLA